MTLDQIVRRNALRFPTRAAMVMGNQRLTWAELDARVDRLANALCAAGLQSGDRVAALLGNCPEYFEIYFACARAGLIAVPLNFRLTAAETTQILEHAEPALLICADEYLATAAEVQQSLPGLGRLWTVGSGASPGVENYAECLEQASPAPMPAQGVETDTFAIFFTSGTTGLPKGAMVSHLNLEMNGYNQMIADRSQRSDANLVATPIYHMGAVFMAVTYMMLGCTQIILPKFDPEAWLETVTRTRATVSLLVPTMINAVLSVPGIDRYDLSGLRLIFYGGGPMHAAVLARAIKTLQCAFTQGYGLTETLEATFLVAEDHELDGSEQRVKRLSSCGREAVGADVRIVNDSGEDLPTGEVGEILVRSRSVISGYWRMPDVTAETIRDGWFYTGDLGYLDEDRYLFLVDRKKDMVVSGGVNIYTKEIETVLYEHPGVLEAAVIGLPDEQWGEAVTAVVVCKPGVQLDDAGIITHCRNALASFKKPRRVFFLDALPKNPSGKILKRELRRTLAS